MACYHPLKAWRGPDGIVFSASKGWSDRPSFFLPCGQCVGCRLERSRVWAVRCVHEASLYERNCFITLTYSDEFLPANGSLVLKDFQDFMKRLRKKFGAGIRFFHCGEYGENFGRPHYHACLFNCAFPDQEFWKFSKGKDRDPIYRSRILEALWPFGHSSIGEVTFKSAAYVARYIMDKKTGELAKSWYVDFDPDTGEVLAEYAPEYVTMSRRPGIGKGWFEKFSADVYPDDFVVMNGKKFRAPRFYDGLYELEHEREFRAIKRSRTKKALRHAENNTPDRLKVREYCHVRKLERLSRDGVD